MPFLFENNLKIIDYALTFYDSFFKKLRLTKLIASKRDLVKRENNHLSLLGIIRQYFKGQNEIDEIVLSSKSSFPLLSTTCISFF